MAMMDVLRGLWRQRSKRKGGYFDSETMSWNRLGVLANSDRVIDPFTQNTWVNAAISAKARNIAAVPFRLYTGKRGTEQKQLLSESDPWVLAFERPSPLFPSWTDFVARVSAYLDRWGEAPIVLLGGDGELPIGSVPAELYLAEPNRIAEDVDRASQVLIGWRVQIGNGATQYLAAHAVVLVKELNLASLYRGASPLAPIAEAVDFDLAIHQFNTALLRNGADPGGIVKVPGARQWTKEQAATFASIWEDKHRGAKKAGRPAVIDKDADYIPLSVNGKQMQWMEALEWVRNEIKSALRVTDFELGVINDYSYATASASKSWLWDNSLVPRMKQIEDCLWSGVFLPWSKRSGVNVWGEFDTSNVPAMRYAFSSRVELVSALAPHYGINDINKRLDLGMPDVAWGNTPSGGSGLEPITGMTPLLASKGLIVHKDARETMERILLRATGEYFRGCVGLALKHLRGTKALDSDHISTAAGSADEWAEMARKVYDAALRRAIDSALRGVRSEGFTVLPPEKALLATLEKQVAQMVRVAKRERTRMKNVLAEAMAEDGFDNVVSLERAIREHFQFQQEARASTIARTEAGFVGAQVRDATFQAEGVERVEWSAAQDEFVRESHRELDGAVIEYGGTFSNGLKYPSQPGGPPEEVINCRCVALPRFI